MDATQDSRFEDVVTMKKVVVVGTFLMMFALLALGVSTAQAAPASWNSNFSAAVKQAEKSGKPLFLLIAKHGCSACDSYEVELSKSKAVKALRNAVKVRAEADDNADLTAQYGASTPTTVVFSPDTGYNTPVFTQVGGLSSSELTALGRSLDAMKK